MELAGKKVLVVGIARSGIAAARLLTSRGAHVTANDIKTVEKLQSEAEELNGLGAELVLGLHPEELFTGADLIIQSPGVPPDLEPFEAARQAGVKIISETELAALFLKGRLIGVTGSNGKTTTTTIAGELMRAAGAPTIVGGNIGTPLTSLIEQSSDESWLVAELSSFQLETIDTLHADVAVVTNITPDHLDRHGSFDSYMQAKHRIFLNQTVSDWAVLNADDGGVTEMATSLGIPSQKVYFSSKGSQAAHLYVRDGYICTSIVSGDNSETRVIALAELQIPGMHNVENVMAALGVVFCTMGTKADDLAPLVDAIKSFKGVEHRIEFVAETGGVRFYNDSKATNVDSTIKALEAFAGNVILILGGKDKGGDFSVLAPLIRERVRHIMLIGAASDKIADQLAGTQSMTRAVSMEDAVLKSREMASSGDVVLLAPACASFDMFDNYEHRGRVFKEAVRNLI